MPGYTGSRFAARGGDDEMYNFTIDSTAVIRMADTSGNYYTMPITRDKRYADVFENLVLCDRDDVQEAYIITYFPDSGNEDLRPSSEVHFEGGMTVKRLDANKWQQRGAVINCVNVTTTYCDWDHTHVAGENCKNTYTKTSTLCNVILLQDFPIEEAPYAFVNNGPQSGGGIPNNPPIVTQPITPQVLYDLRGFKKGLSPGQLEFWNDPANAAAVSKIIAYLNQGEQGDEERTDMAKQVIQFVVDNENSEESINLAVEALSDILNNNVPSNIFNVINMPCQKDVINDLLNVSSPFTNDIQQVFGASTAVNLQISNGNITGNGAAETIPIPQGSPENYTINIRIDDAFLNSATDLSIAAAVLHELVHAYLIDLYLKGQLTAQNANYGNLLNAFINFYKDYDDATFQQLDDEIHYAMSHFTDKMASALYNYAQSKGLSNVNSDYCKALAWSTMQGYNLFEETLTPQQQNNYLQIGYNEENNTGTKKGSKCP
jgi:hypothetical protein